MLYALEPKSREAETIRQRFPFYMPDWDLLECGCMSRREIIEAAARKVPVLYPEQLAMESVPGMLKGNPRYWLNPWEQQDEAVEWLGLVRDVSTVRPDLAAARRRLIEYIQTRQLGSFPRCYVFGTGPSLVKAMERDWSDGARLVCNTIVRDATLWHHIQPHMILAVDAAYHYSFTEHACAFRADLRRRLAESDTLYLYAAEYHALVAREFADFPDRLVPIPMGKHKRVDMGLAEVFEWPGMHNILPRLLNVAFTICNDAWLWGFDGRAPQAQGFWDNSSRHSYPELMPGLRDAYPGFYDSLVPKNNEQWYIKRAFGEELERCLQEAERNGRNIVMMHETWTGTLKKRLRTSAPSETLGTADSMHNNGGR